jgi:hypothetical protein
MESMNRRNFLKGAAAGVTAAVMPEIVSAENYRDVERAPDDQEFSVDGFYPYLGFVEKFNKKSYSCKIVAHNLAIKGDGDFLNFSVNDSQFSHDFRSEAEKKLMQPTMSYNTFESRMKDFLSTQEQTKDCFGPLV